NALNKLQTLTGAIARSFVKRVCGAAATPRPRALELVVHAGADHAEALADFAVADREAVIVLGAQVDIEIFGLEREIGRGLGLEADTGRPAEMIGDLGGGNGGLLGGRAPAIGYADRTIG